MVAVTALALLALLLPGYLTARAARFDRLVSAAFAPALPFALYFLASVALPDAALRGTTWRAIAWGSVLVVAGAVAFVIRRRQRDAAVPTDAEPSGIRVGRATWVALGASVAVQLTTAIAAMGDLNTPLERRDALFHLSMIAGVRGGWTSLDPVGSTAWMSGAVEGGYYPSGFYTVAAALPGPVAAGANLLLLALAAFWMVGLTALARAALPKHRGAWVAAPLLATVTMSYPVVTLVRHGQWPLGASFALVPVMLALLVTLRERQSHEARRRGPILAALAALTLAIVGLQVSTLVIPLVAVGCYVLRSAITGRGTWTMGRVPAVVLLVLAVAAVVAVAVVGVGASGVLATMTGFERDTAPARTLLRDALTWVHTHHWEPIPNHPSWLLAAATLAGIVVLLRDERARELGGTTLVFMLLLAATTWTDPVSRLFTAVFYRDPERVQAVLVTFSVLAVAALVGVVAEFVARGRRGVLAPALAVALTVGLLAPTALPMLRDRGPIMVGGNYHPKTDEYHAGGGTWTDDDAAVWEQWRGIVGEGVVFGDASSGSALLPTMAGVRAVPTLARLRDLPEDGRDLVETLRASAIPQDGSPGCEYLRRNGVRYVYLDPEPQRTRFDKAWGIEDGAHLLGPVVAREGRRELIEVTVCQ